MNWKALGKALLVVGGWFALIGIVLLVGYYFPWTIIVLIFIAVVTWVYNGIDSRDSDPGDSSRMSWFSNDEDIEDEEEEK